MKIAVIRIKGEIGLKKEIKDSFKMLNLPKKFSCAVLEDSPVNRGMLVKVKDFVTFGAVTEETLNLMKKREEKGKKFFRLHPPRGGFERKGTKKSFKEEGSLGDRGEKINDLIKRMV